MSRELVIGASIIVGDASARVTTLRTYNHKHYLVTCGHVFRSTDEVRRPGSDVVIARLSNNLLDRPRAVDLAFAELTAEGMEIMHPDARWETAPPGGAGWIAREGRKLRHTVVDVYPAYDAPFYPSGPYIRTRFAGEEPGDSGACLLREDLSERRICGLLKGRAELDGRWFGFYVPLDGLL